MSNEKQDLINHRLTATACKNYTDKEIKKAKDELKTFFSKNTVNTEDHTNELAYQITAPAGAKLLQLQSIGGNSVKYEPSVASDDTTALVKTMPSVVYDFDVNKVKGVSEVSENLLVLSDKAETTTNGITYKVENGVIYVSGTATAQTDITFGLDKTLSADSYYLMIFNWQTNLGIDYFIVNQDYNYDFYNLSDGSSVIKTMTFNGNENLRTLFIRITNGTTISGTLQLKPMLVKGTTAPTEFKVGYEGIHNNELTGFKVETGNLCNYNELLANQYTIANDGSYTSDNTRGCTDYLEVKSNDYKVSFDVQVVFISVAYYDENKTYMSRSIVNDSKELNLSIPSNAKYLRFSFQYQYATPLSTTILNNIKPTLTYVSQTIPIDLTSIVDSSGNKLFEDGSLKGINDVYDEITPYKATKRFGVVDLGSLNWERTNETTGTYIFRSIIAESLNILIPSNNVEIYNKGIISNNYKMTRCYLPDNPMVYNTDKSFAIRTTQPNYPYGAFEINDSSYTDATTFKAAMSGVYLVYELATPIEADIDLPQLKSIQGHSNGSITAQNTYDMQVPSEIRYNSIIQDTLADSITIEGANLIGLNDETTSNYKISNGEITIFSTTVVEIELKNTITLIANQTYYFSRFTVSAQLNTILMDENKKEIVITQWGIGNTTYTPTSNIVIKYIKWNASSNSVGITFKPMLVRDSTAPTTFRPYKETITRLLPNSEAKYGCGINADVHNLRVFSDYEGNETKERHIIVGKVDLGSLNYERTQWGQNYVFQAVLNDMIKTSTNNVNLLCPNYSTVSESYLYNNVVDKVISNNASGNMNLKIVDNIYTDATTFKRAMSGVYLYYELAIEDISQLDDFDYFFDVEEGDTITFNNPYAQQVYATYSFITKEVKPNE